MKRSSEDTGGYPDIFQSQSPERQAIPQPCGMSAKSGKDLLSLICRFFLVVVLIATGTISCTGHIQSPPKGANHQAAYRFKHSAGHRPKHEIESFRTPDRRFLSDSEVAARLEEAWRNWQATPHRMGGTGKGGIDCSGLVQVLYRELFGIYLPRTVSAQVKLGRQVSRRRLRPGDLVFFRPPGKYRHVGIYMGKQRFLHASARHGVMVSSMSDYYWAKYYWTARRYW